jgi:hypothetical protein
MDISLMLQSGNVALSAPTSSYPQVVRNIGDRNWVWLLLLEYTLSPKLPPTRAPLLSDEGANHHLLPMQISSCARRCAMCSVHVHFIHREVAIIITIQPFRWTEQKLTVIVICVSLNDILCKLHVLHCALSSHSSMVSSVAQIFLILIWCSLINIFLR